MDFFIKLSFFLDVQRALLALKCCNIFFPSITVHVCIFFCLFVTVLLYLVMFRLDELGVAELKKFVLTQRIHKMYKVSSREGHHPQLRGGV